MRPLPAKNGFSCLNLFSAIYLQRHLRYNYYILNLRKETVMKKNPHVLQKVHSFALFLSITLSACTLIASEPVKNISIPPTLGVITDTYQGTSDTCVIHVRDLHSNPLVQRNIADIIGYFRERYDIPYLFVEGYWGEYDLSPVRLHPADQSLKDALTEYFLKKGTIAGSEYYSLTADEPPFIYGIEDKRLYDKNRQAFQDVMKTSSSVRAVFQSMNDQLEQRSEEVCNDELRAFYAEYYACFWQKNIDFESFANRFAKHMGTIELSESETAVIQDFFRTIQLEKNLNHQRLDIELKKFFNYVSVTFSAEKPENLFSDYLGYLVGKVNGNDFFIQCGSFAEQKNIDLSAYAQLHSRIELAHLHTNLDSTKLFNALHAGCRQIIEHLAQTDEEINLCIYRDYLALAETATDLNLTGTEWQWFTSFREKTNLDAIADYISDNSESAFSENILTQLNDVINTGTEFYTLSHQRDSILCDTTLAQMQDQDIEFSIQITGGFHSEHILETLRAKGISYIAITPRAQLDVEANMYSNIMIGYRTYLEKVLGLQNFQTNTLAPELVAVKLLTTALDQLEGVALTPQFANTFYQTLASMNKLDFEAGGKILDLFKSSTPLSPHLIDEFLAGKLTEKDKDFLLEMILMSSASSYMDPRYLAKLREYGYLDISDEALDEFSSIITAVRRIDRDNRTRLIETIKKQMNGTTTVEQNPVTREYNGIDNVINQLKDRSVVYFSPEMKLLGGVRSLFAGGLGVLAGEYVEGLADLGIPTYGVTLLYKKTVRQKIENGKQITEEISVDYSKLPVFDTGIVIEQNVMGVPVRARVWEIRAGDARIFALEDLTSDVTDMLYGGEKETAALREQQNQLLGRGGIQALQIMLDNGIIDKKPAILHKNEANCWGATDEVLFRQMFQEQFDPNGYWQDIGMAFTTHTPVPAGLPKISASNFGTNNIIHLGWLLGIDQHSIIELFVPQWDELDAETRARVEQLAKSDMDQFTKTFLQVLQSEIVLNLTEAEARISDVTSSVSLRHEEVTNAEIIKAKKSPSRHEEGTLQASIGITNGVLLHDWQPPEFQFTDPETITDETLINVKQREKAEYIAMINDRTGSNLSADHLTISIMRRTNLYKRTDMILQDIDALAEKLKGKYGDMPINIVFSGIAHPKDEPAKQMFQTIQAAIERKHPTVHVAVVPQYDITVAKYGVRGSDIWLMMPVEKMEASSTSHQKALGSGTIILSSFDGAMIEEVADIDDDPANANGAFLTPIILSRTIPKDNFKFIEAHTSQNNGNNGFYQKPVIAINGGGEYHPVAVIDKGDKYIIIDDIISDISAENIQRHIDANPIHLRESGLDLSKLITADGKISSEELRKMWYQTLAPLTTGDLIRLYYENKEPWYSRLYDKVGHLAELYYGAQHGDADMRSRYANLLRNSLRRSYEVDIHRMALDYVRDMYSVILQKMNSRAEKQQSLFEELIPNQDMRDAVIARRSEILQAKQAEYDRNLTERLVWGYVGNGIGTNITKLTTSADANENLHATNEPMQINVDLQLGWVVQPDDFVIELHYGLPSEQEKVVEMNRTQTLDMVNKQYRYSAVIVPEAEGQYQFRTVIRPVNPRLVNVLNSIHEAQSNEELAKALPEYVTRLADLVKKEPLDQGMQRWFPEDRSIDVVTPVTASPRAITDIDSRAQELLGASL
ncbi:MAG: alpha-glucan family phosphorylase [Candidatus Auribacter fodinae]|uniref:Alpha-glucan family phosphorylase n=1 Tax=Candidatus Auribacter fodinae TaxID=2093366 RepID=A0A3A4R0T6_9BACT|nr:MAG: alpha-glucan family phosphorylase [Candidatus Auribacter fodinae]